MLQHIIAILLFLMIGSSYARPTIIFAKGTACAGKTSLLDAIAKKDPSVKIIDEDAIFYDLLPKFLEKKFPKEYKVIAHAFERKNIVHALLRNQFLFNDKCEQNDKKQAQIVLTKIRNKLDNVRKEDKAELSKMFRKVVSDQVANYETTNDYIVIDCWTLGSQEITELSKKFNVITACIYCPLDTLVTRLLKRNADAETDKHMPGKRFYNQIFESYAPLYRVTYNQDIAIDTLNKEQLSKMFDTVKANLQDEATSPLYANFARRELTRDELEEYKEELFAKLGLNDRSQVFICPTFSYDFVVHTKDVEPKQAAEEFMKKLNQFKQTMAKL